MKHTDELDQLAPALAAAQQAMRDPLKDSVNPHFRKRYASLGACLEAAKGPLNANGITLLQSPTEAPDGYVGVTTMLLHISGQWIRDTVFMPLAKADPQGVGSATTYGCRYGLNAICGIAADEDDDGNAASTPPAQKQAAPPPKAPVKEAPAGPTEKQLTVVTELLSSHVFDADSPFGADRVAVAAWFAKLAGAAASEGIDKIKAQLMARKQQEQEADSK